MIEQMGSKGVIREARLSRFSQPEENVRINVICCVC